MNRSSAEQTFTRLPGVSSISTNDCVLQIEAGEELVGFPGRNLEVFHRNPCFSANLRKVRLTAILVSSCQVSNLSGNGFSPISRPVRPATSPTAVFWNRAASTSNRRCASCAASPPLLHFTTRTVTDPPISASANWAKSSTLPFIEGFSSNSSRGQFQFKGSEYLKS